jgi:uncharacterized protein YcbX
MKRTFVGILKALWCYPVKSMQGEELNSSDIGILCIGDSVKLKIDTACPRCVVTTLAQANLPNDLTILKTVAQHLIVKLYSLFR